jgi:hypothetical protein
MARAALILAAVAAVVMTATIAMTAAPAGEVGWIEEFALAPDRAAPLKALIPETEDYYHYNCLNLQTSGRLDDVDKLPKLWIERYNRTGGVLEIENRQAILL